MRRALLVLALGLGLPACYPAPVRQEAPRIRFVIEPSTARVYQEDRFLGSARLLAQRPHRFDSPGVRFFTITAEGYFPHDVEIHVPRGLTTVRLALRPVPP
jgi:hypothetical protein